jgi:hypothetical protein
MIAYIYRKNPILLCCFYAFVIYINNKRGSLFFTLQTVQAQKAAPFFAMPIMAVFPCNIWSSWNRPVLFSPSAALYS